MCQLLLSQHHVHLIYFDKLDLLKQQQETKFCLQKPKEILKYQVTKRGINICLEEFPDEKR